VGGGAESRPIATLRFFDRRAGSANAVAIPVNAQEHWSLTGVIALLAAG
jgi:hypothetical protein